MANDQHDEGKGGGASAAAGIAERLKEAFADYVREHDIQPEGDRRDLNVDLDFVRTHGGPLVTHMLKSVTQSLMPNDLSFTVPAGERREAATDDDDATADEGTREDERPVQIHFDLGDFLSRLLTPPRDPSSRDR